MTTIHVHIHRSNSGEKLVNAVRSVPSRTAAIKAKFEQAVKIVASLTGKAQDENKKR